MNRPTLVRFARVLGAVTAIGMFLVLVIGATVTNTGSEHGCGRSWPLCHGKLIPQFAVSTAIEFSHRAIVGVESVLILALAAVALYLYWPRVEVRILTALMVIFLFLQAGLGAWAVMAPQLAAVLALHFGVSLIAFASVLLTAVFLFEVGGSEALRSRRPPSGFPLAVWGLTAFSYVVVYLGAYVRHTDADEGCRGWPLCNGAVIPTLHGHTTSIFAHRIAAGLLTLAIVGLVMWARRFRASRPDIYRASHIAFGLVVLQALAGAVVTWTHLDLFSALAHAGLVGLLFGSLTYLCVHVLPQPETREQPAHAAPFHAAETVSASR